MKYYAASDVGVVREQNEDYIFASKDAIGNLPNLFVVADGMGGHKAGEYASRYAISEIIKILKNNPSKDPVSLIKDAINSANIRVYTSSTTVPEYAGMGTTVALVSVIGNIAYIANVGDSRTYLIHKGESSFIKQISKDHSLVEELVALGELERDSDIYNSKKNIITRAIGAEPTIEIDDFETELKPGDLLLVCSDGLSNMLSDKDILSIIKTETKVEDMVKKLIINSKKNGGYDNISAIIVNPEI